MENGKTQSQESGLEFSIDKEDILIPEKCPYLGFSFSFDSRDTSPSLDRINPTKGYTRDNIQVISWRANRYKSNATVDDLIAFARGILATHTKEDTFVLLKVDATQL